MYECKYPHLFSPIMIGGTLFRNRIFASPTGGHHTHSERGNRPINELICYYERKAVGGAASVCIGDAMVDSEIALANGNHIELDDPSGLPHLSKLAEAISRHGAVASMEMSHGGSGARSSFEEGHRIYGPVECETESFGRKVHAYAMTEEIMERTIRKHYEAAAFAKRCGFGMVTLHGGHGWLLHQFMSPTLNTRTDQYGGSFENRMRFPLAVIKAVRDAVGPNFPIEIRLSGAECYEGGYDTAYGVKIAEALDGKVDLLHISTGSHEDARVFTVTHPSMFLADGCNVIYAAEVKKHVSTPVATVGALSEPELLEEIIASGKADVVEMARGLICDPDLPIKARTGRDDEIVHCMRCFTCFSNLMAHSQFHCALNPEICNESETKFEKPPAHRKKVLIAGGGIGGMQAALTACARGHEVILCEKGPRLGGVLRCEDKVPFKKHLSQYLDRQERMIGRSAIEVRLNTEVDADYARSVGADVIVAALGSKPAKPPIPGIEKTIGAEELYVAPEKAGKRIVILGGGLVGCELAIFMAGRGHEVTVLEMAPMPNFGENILQGQSIGIEFDRLGIKLRTSTKALKIEDGGVTAQSASGEEFFAADTVVSALGMKPLREEAEKLCLCAPEFYQIGDCLSVSNIYNATNTAYHIAYDIGRY